MKKSKFLKKSLAMLLALMLVVAMIPLSAAAAEAPSGVVRYITVNGVTVDLQSSNRSVQVNDLSADVEVKLAADLTGHYQLQAIAAPSVSTTETAEITVNGVTGYPTGLPANRYVTKTDDKTATISLQLVDTKDTPATSDDTKYDPYVITLNQVDARTTTNLSEDVVLGKGVYSAEVDNVNKVINVVLARHTGEVWDATTYNQTTQNELGALIEVTPLEGATVDGVTPDRLTGTYEVGADNDETFTVTSESEGNHSTYKVVATYKDAIKSFSVDGVDGVISDEDKNDVPDTITVTLPKDAINDQWGYPVTNPEFAVDYEVEGNVHCTVSIYQTNIGNAIVSNLVGGEDVPFNGLSLTNDEWTGTVRVYRLGTGTNANNANDAIQVYNLKVQLEDSTDTDITYARVDRTIASVDLDNGTITAELPANVGNDNDNVPTNMGAVELNLYTASTTSKVVVNGVEMDEITNTADADYAAGRKAWRLYGVDVRTTAVVTVYAEDGVTTRQYTVNAQMAQARSDASITAFYIGDYEGVITQSGGANTPDVITVTVPYMTLDVTNLPIYATASAGAKVQYILTGNNEPRDVINGYHKAGDISLGGTIPVDGALTTTITAIDKIDETVTQDYTVRVVLDKPAATGNRLEGLHFTAQPVTNDSDRDIMHAIDEDENVFTANVWENTDSSNNVGTINLKIAPSLMDNREGNFNNVVTDYTTVDGGVAFAVTWGKAGVRQSPDVELEVLDCTDSDVDPDDITGHILNTNINDTTGANTEIDQIVVLPEEIARQVLTGTAPVSQSITDNTGRISSAAILEHGTIYDVEITADLHSSEDDLISFTVGDTELTVNTSNNTISGVLPWSATDADGDGSVVTTWELAKYAKAFICRDESAEGMWNLAEAESDSLIFHANANHTVTVQNASGQAINSFEVQAEDRLTVSNGKVPSYTDWTFNLTWKDACDDADFESFSINGVNGVIDDSDPDNRTITVNLPFASDVTGLVAEFETSPEATVTLTTPDGVLVESGVTSINYTNTVLLYVHSESGENVNSYKVTVNLGSHFSDIDEDDWYYDNVMDAADNGYISGMGDGTFNPMGSTTRAQFASMIANAMGYEADPEAPSMFRDVADDFWGKAAINFCVQNGILTGYEDGSFQPNKAITRQEAASILRNAFELTETTSELFPDDSAIAGWAKESVYLVKASGLMKGDAGTGNFRPTSTITRAEAASILMNAKYAGVIN